MTGVSINSTEQQVNESIGLSPSELEHWHEHGFVVREGVFGQKELGDLCAAADSAEQKALSLSDSAQAYNLDGKRFFDSGYTTIQFEHSPQSRRVRVIEPVHELEARFDQLIDDERIVAPMRSILEQSALSLWTAKLNLKAANEGSGFGWHQDSPYWVHDSDHVDQLPNVMLTFDDANLDNGCLQVIRRSHTRGCLPGTNDGSQLGGFFTDPQCFSEDDAVAMEVPAGSLIFFSAHSIHGSGVNRSSKPRRAIILTYQPAGFPALKSKVVRPVA